MNTEEIFKELAGHMIQGMMFHDEMANYYEFLGLTGYARCHEYHFIDETCSYRKLCKYYISHENRLVPYVEVEDPEAIPESWYKYSRQEVDASTKKNAVKSGLEKWVAWEKETKELYEKMYKELVSVDAIADAKFVAKLIHDVDCELAKAEKYHLAKSAIGYDMIEVVNEQDEKCEHYTNKMKGALERLC